MLTLADALSEVLAIGDEWAAQALVRLGVENVSVVQVCAASPGWIRRFDGSAPSDAPALFLLLPDRIGCGAPESVSGVPQWIPLAAVTALEAMDEHDTPLDTVEVHTRDSVLTVGWTSAFCQAVVAALSDQGSGEVPPPPTQSAVPVDGSANRSTGELTAPVATTVHDPSSLDSMPPSGWTEPPVAPSGMATLAVTPPPPPAWAVPPDSVSPLAPLPEDPTETVQAAPVQTAPGPTPAPLMTTEPVGPPAPWSNPSMVWPDPIRGVAYVGGHPDHPRRRKNGTLTFSPAGWTLAGGGLSSWHMAFSWSDLEHISIQNAEELEFCEGIKIDATSSALSMQLVTGEELLVEVRMRRPPSLRAALAPVLLMAEAIPVWRADLERREP